MIYTLLVVLFLDSYLLLIDPITLAGLMSLLGTLSVERRNIAFAEDCDILKTVNINERKVMTIEIYGIPNCGTCKKALQWLDSNGINYKFINTKENPPSRELIEAWAKLLTTKAMRNTSGQSYRALGEQKQDWSDTQWIDAFAKDAMLLKRPLFVKEGTAVLVGFRAKESELRQKLGV